MKKFPAYIFVTDGWDLPRDPHAKQYRQLKEKVGEEFVQKVRDAILYKGYLEVCVKDVVDLLEGKNLPTLNDYTGYELSNKTWSQIQQRMKSVA